MTTLLWVVLLVLLAGGNLALLLHNRTLRRRVAEVSKEAERLRREVRGPTEPKGSQGKDPLTGCLDRTHIAAFEAKAIGDQEQWGCVVMDITGLQRVNSEHGRQLGDVALKRMARFLTLQVRAGEAVVRLGEDEFLALVTGVDDTTIGTVADRIRQLGEREAPLPFTMGWAARRGTESLRQTLSRARADMMPVEVRSRFPGEQSRRF